MSNAPLLLSDPNLLLFAPLALLAATGKRRRTGPPRLRRGLRGNLLGDG